MIYLDHAATTPLDQRVLEAMLPYLRDQYGNASSVHAMGQAARRAVDQARGEVAALIGADPSEIIFTSGGTEADNLAVRGLPAAHGDVRTAIVTSAIEHHAVLHACRAEEVRGARLAVVRPDGRGRLDPAAVRQAVDDRTALVTVMAANNELGTIEPVREIAEIAHEKGAIMHTDAVQVAGQLPLDVQELQVDALSLTAHKFYGPKGVGALYLRRGIAVDPLQTGGGQERGRRAGTENVAGIVGFGAAARLARQEMEVRAAHMRTLRDRLWRTLCDLPGAERLGDPQNCLPGHLLVRFRGVDGEALVLNLDLHGICGSMGSACSSGSLEASHVLTGIGLDPQSAREGLRLTVGRGNTTQEIDETASVLRRIVERQRELMVSHG